jgi:hypothetical protein
MKFGKATTLDPGFRRDDDFAGNSSSKVILVQENYYPEYF